MKKEFTKITLMSLSIILLIYELSFSQTLEEIKNELTLKSAKSQESEFDSNSMKIGLTKNNDKLKATTRTWYSKDPQDLEILRNTKWGIIHKGVNIEKSLSWTLTFEDDVKFDSDGDVHLHCLTGSTNGAVWYRDLIDEAGGGKGFWVYTPLTTDTNLYYQFKIYDNKTLMGVYYTKNNETGEFSEDILELSGVKIDCSSSGECTQEDLEAQYNSGKQYCINNPESCGIKKGQYTEEDMVNMVNKLLEWDVNDDRKIDLIEVLQTLRDLTGIKKDEKGSAR